MFHKFMVAGLCTRETESLFEQSIWNIWTLTKISKQYSHLCKAEMAIISSISPGFFFHTSEQSKGSFEIRKALSGIDFRFYIKALSLAFTCKNKVVVSLQTQSVFSSLFGLICHQCDITRLYCWRHHCRRHLCQNGILTRISFEVCKEVNKLVDMRVFGLFDVCASVIEKSLAIATS